MVSAVIKMKEKERMRNKKIKDFMVRRMIGQVGRIPGFTTQQYKLLNLATALH